MIRHIQNQMASRQIDSLYVEAMLLVDEARGYFDDLGREDRDALPPLMRVGFSCESLRVTTRLMHVIAWLLTRRAVEAGEISERQALAPERRLGRAQASDPEVIGGLPEAARQIIQATADLYARVQRLDDGLDRDEVAASPARGLMSRLERAF
jgi:regulator of CtrA degradation